MTSQDFQELRERASMRRDAVMKPKGIDYQTGDGDRLGNFKVVGARLGLSPLEVWAVYFSKHLDAVFSYVRNGKVESEPITGRLDDCVNYLELVEGLIEDLKGEKPSAG